MKFITFRNNTIAYQSVGKGIPVVLLHGFCEDSSIWDELQADLLEEGYRIIRIDLPGFGKSSVIKGANLEMMAEAVHAVLVQLKLDKVVLIGHSMGGYASLCFARLYPEKLLGLGLFHSHPYPDSEEKRENRQKSIEFIKRQGHILFVKQLIPKLFSPKFAASNAFLLEKLTYRASKNEAAGIIAGQKAMMIRNDESQVLKDSKVPVLFIIGTEDETVPPQSKEQVHLPAIASIHILEKVAHMGMFEARKKTQRIVRQFVAFCQETSEK